ncbi:MAG: hypothetical protein WCV91_05295 [Candidatus Margulisiibacteriota bacterium]|jgi:hypothetical protein
MPNEKSALEKLEEYIKELWRKSGNASVIAAKHSEFVVEPKVFIGDKLNPEILKMLTINYLAHSSRNDSGIGNIDASPEKLVIKTSKGKPVVVVRDKKIIKDYYASQSS